MVRWVQVETSEQGMATGLRDTRRDTWMDEFLRGFKAVNLRVKTGLGT
jgi:hypothetical protein